MLQEFTMASNKKFEKMIELLINEDKSSAEELFHEIVVEKSREIYESILEKEYEDMDDEMGLPDDEIDIEGDDMDDDDIDLDDEDLTDEWDLEEDDLMDDWDLEEGDPMEAMGGDETDDFIGDVGMDDDDMDGDDMDDMDGDDMDGMDDMGDDDMENRMEDLEDEIEQLKAELEKMIGDKDTDDMDDDDDMPMDMGDEDEDEDEGEDEKEEDEDEDNAPMPKTESKKSAAERMREYVEKVSHGSGPYGDTSGDDGDNTASPVAGKNDMGGTVGNLNQGGEADTTGTKGGLASPEKKDMNTGNVNVPGGKASKSMRAMPKGHGAEKKGAGETAGNTMSTLSGVKGRK